VTPYAPQRCGRASLLRLFCQLPCYCPHAHMPLTPPSMLHLACRPLLSERAVLDRADGSAKWAQEGSAVLAAVHGPHQAGQRREDAERAVVEVLVKPRNGMAGAAGSAWYS
jgi:hypothetical protein